MAVDEDTNCSPELGQRKASGVVAGASSGSTTDNEESLLAEVLVLASQLFEESGLDDMDVLSNVITLIRERIQELEGATASTYPAALRELAALLWRRFQKKGQVADLDEIIDSWRQVLRILPSHHPDYPSSLYYLANALLARFEQVPEPRLLLEAAIQRHLQALQFGRDLHHPDRQTSLDNLEFAISILVQYDGSQLVLEELRTLLHGPQVSEKKEQQEEDTHHESAIPNEREESQPAEGGGIVGASTAYSEDAKLDEVLALASQLLRDSGPDDMDVLDTTIVVIQEGIKEFPTPDSSSYTKALHQLAALVWRRFQQKHHLIDLKETISLRRRIVKLCPSSGPARITSLYNLAVALSTPFERVDEHDDLEEALSLHLEVLKGRRHPNPERQSSLDSLVLCLSSLYQAGTAFNHGVIFRRGLLSLLQSFESGARRDDPEVAMLLYRHALNILPRQSSSYPYALNRLVDALEARAEERGWWQEELDEAITLHREALSLRPLSHPDHPSSLTNLALALRTRFKQGGGKLDDLDECITLHNEALALQPSLRCPNRLTSVNNLAVAFLERFEQGGGPQKDLNVAIMLLREVLSLQSPQDPGRISSLNNLAIVLSTRLKYGGGPPEDRHEVIMLLKEALALWPSSHPDRANSLDSLAGALRSRFEHVGGQRDDIDKAIMLHREALALQPSPHPDRIYSLRNLAVALKVRVEQGGGQQEDIDESIKLYREALVLLPPFHIHRPTSLDGLAYSLQTRFNFKLGNWQQEDLDEAIMLHRESLTIQPLSHPKRFLTINNLAMALMTRCHQGLGDRQRQDLNEGISLHREALALQPFPHLGRPPCLNNLALALRKRSDLGGRRREDLDEAIKLHREALSLYPSSHPDRSGHLTNLGLLYAYSATGGSKDVDQAISLFSEATHHASQNILWTFRAAKRWVDCADRYQHPSALHAYDAVLRTLPQLAAINLDIHARQSSLTAGSDGLARRAAICAIRAGKVEKAVEFLETGRGVFWSQMLRLRTPVEKIPVHLRERFRRTGAGLEQGSHRSARFTLSTNEEKLLSEQEDSHLSRLAKEWSELIDEVRLTAGFENFYLPRSLSSLQSSLLSPVVILVADDELSDCLVMTPTAVHHILLPNLRNEVLRSFVRLIARAASGSVVPNDVLGLAVAIPSLNAFRRAEDVDKGRSWNPEAHNRDHVSSEDAFRRVLHFLWKDVVKPVIDVLNMKPFSQELPILQWCPTGLFSFLPVHAAGSYPRGRPSDCASNYFIPSYTPTIGALLAHSEDPVHSVRSFKMTVVVEPHTLRHARDELSTIERHVPKEALVALGVHDSLPASVESVASHLSDSTIVHFACHGKQQTNPLDSGLKIALADSEVLTISRIMKEPMPNGSLAFLSACETAMGDQNLPDEAMSLGASLLFSGFRRVVATMWSIRDVDGPKVADAFYEELFRGPDGSPISEPDTSKSARALHVAVRKLRSSGAPFHAWVPFIHMGQ